MVSNFALCGMPFLAGFYSRDFILEVFSMRYVNMFGFLFFHFSNLACCEKVGLMASSCRCNFV